MNGVDWQVGEIIFTKSQKNLKKIYNRLNSTNLNQYVKAEKEEVLFLAIGGYNRTHDLIKAMGLTEDEITSHANLNLTNAFLQETHEKKVIYIEKINYLTSVNKNIDFVSKKLDLNVADAFEESMMLYKVAERQVVINKRRVPWKKPLVVILDDKSLNLQYDGHRFKYQTEVGFVQMRNRNAKPATILKEIESVEEIEKMSFARYQTEAVGEEEVLDALARLQTKTTRNREDSWWFKPAEFKQIVGSNELVVRLKEIKELGITQFSSNKKYGTENARWLVVPDDAFEFKGFDYKDDADLFEEEVQQEVEEEERISSQQELILKSILNTEIPLNIKTGYVGRGMAYSSSESLQSFLNDVDEIEQEKINGIELLSGSSTEEEYKHIKKYKLAYFLDGTYKDDERLDENYLGGKRLISIDIDDADYTREELENKLEAQGLFGLVYRTAKYYYDQSNRWRIILMADEAMTKNEYRHTLTGVSKMLDLEIDDASKKLSQLMGYPLSSKDMSIVIGTMVNVAQFKPKEHVQHAGNVIGINQSSKTLADFDHPQAKLLKQALNGGITEGSRNESYRQICMYLRDTINNPKYESRKQEAYELIEITKAQAIVDGLPEKEVEVIYREELHQSSN